jgi:calcineurin-like phosphoesterase family protein
VCISDTHNTRPPVPDGDVLLHAGDLTIGGTFAELRAQLDWLRHLPHRHKVVVAGNHDLLLDAAFVARHPEKISSGEGEGASRDDLPWGDDIIYLDNSAATLRFPGGRRSLSVYGSPWTPQFGNWAFQHPPVREVWEGSVPPGTDILLTHGPPRGHLDLEGKGCPQLLREIWRARPRLVVFGHIHGGYGREDIGYDAVEACYDGVMTGDKGLVAAVMMACRLFWGWLRDALLLSPRPQHPSRRTTLVNAAAVAGRFNEEQQPAIVVYL